MWNSFRFALKFLTRIPVTLDEVLSDEELGRSTLFYPLVGLIIGGLLLLLFWPLAGHDSGVVAALTLIVWVLLTGGLHLDGLADSADAWVGGHKDPERTLEIMKDPRSGPAAVVFVVLLLILKFAALSTLIEAQAWLALLLAPFLGRVTIIALMLTTPYVRPQGIASELYKQIPRVELTGLLLASLLIVILVLAWWGIVLLGATGLLFYLMRSLMLKRIGGTTGDTLGAAIEVTEGGVLLVLALAWNWV
jgi:adenosylcobinamide-GDP ribazoletransferase